MLGDLGLTLRREKWLGIELGVRSGAGLRAWPEVGVLHRFEVGGSVWLRISCIIRI